MKTITLIINLIAIIFLLILAGDCDKGGRTDYYWTFPILLIISTIVNTLAIYSNPKNSLMIAYLKRKKLQEIALVESLMKESNSNLPELDIIHNEIVNSKLTDNGFEEKDNKNYSFPKVLYYLGHSVKSIINFRGRASRKEYWLFFIIWFVLGILLVSPYPPRRYPEEYIITKLFLSVFILSVSVRRLHDLGRSMTVFITIFLINFGVSIYLLNAIIVKDFNAINTNFSIINFVTMIYGIWLFISFCRNGQDTSNKYGSGPYRPQNENSSSNIVEHCDIAPNDQANEENFEC